MVGVWEAYATAEGMVIGLITVGVIIQIALTTYRLGKQAAWRAIEESGDD